MTDDNIVGFPDDRVKATRRRFLGAAAGAAAIPGIISGAAGGTPIGWQSVGEAAATAVECQNPLLALWTRRAAVIEIINGPDYDLDDDPLCLPKEERAIEDKICAAVATTPTDLIIQVKLLVALGEWNEWDKTFDQLCENLEEGIFQMARRLPGRSA
jgi:hypothetical protein